MSIIAALKTYIEGYSELETDAPVWVNHLGETPINYAIIPIGGTRIVSEDLVGNSEREYPFAFQSAESTAEDLARLESMGFYEDFADWMESQTAAGSFPNLGSGKTVTKIEVLGQAFLYEQGESDTGIYQIQCVLAYDQEA